MANNEENEKKDELRDSFDCTLDAVLAKFVSVEPRDGLEQRLLASLRAADVPLESRSWWMWGLAVAMAAFILVAGSLIWRSSAPTHRPKAEHPSKTRQTPVQATNRERILPLQKKRLTLTSGRSPQHEVTAINPKLDVFPSPLPLSEQEKILAGYVREYPEHAALVAVARMDVLRQEAEEQRRLAAEKDENQ